MNSSKTNPILSWIFELLVTPQFVTKFKTLAAWTLDLTLSCIIQIWYVFNWSNIFKDTEILSKTCNQIHWLVWGLEVEKFYHVISSKSVEITLLGVLYSVSTIHIIPFLPAHCEPPGPSRGNLITHCCWNGNHKLWRVATELWTPLRVFGRIISTALCLRVCDTLFNLIIHLTYSPVVASCWFIVHSLNTFLWRRILQ